MKRWLVFLLAALVCTALATETALSPRIRERLDDNWRFRRDPLPKRGVDLFDWEWKKAEDVSISVRELPADLDTGAWAKTYAGRDVFRDRIGYAWVRTDLGSGVRAKDTLLSFDSVDDSAVVFLNGKVVKRHDQPTAFEIPITGAWKPEGPNRLVLLIRNIGGAGGILGDVSLTRPQTERFPEDAKAGFNDRAWRVVQLPHDYVIEGTVTPEARQGGLHTVPAWYRKSFTIPESYRGKSVWVDFDGIFRNSTIYFNGRKIGSWASGYSGFRLPLNRHAIFGGRNVLAIRVDPTQAEGWWYEGGGIYRHVWLNAADPLHVRPWGVAVQTEVPSLERAVVLVSTDVDNASPVARQGVVVWRIIGSDGRTVATSASVFKAAASGSAKVGTSISFAKPRLWSPDSPNLYTLDTEVFLGEKVVDRVRTRFGVRTFRFDADDGFFLNGKALKLKGVAIHQDHAGVGIAVPDSLAEWRIRRLKEMGVNAIRIAYHPHSSEVLEACDRLGMLVVNENRHLGDARTPKSPPGTATSDLIDLRSLVLRDRNHPSVIAWSLFNEEPLQATAEGVKIFAAMRKAVREMDPTRPCTGSMEFGWGTGISTVMDLQGLSYGISGYDPFHMLRPSLPAFASETGGSLSTRGVYVNDSERGHFSGYDLNHERWGTSLRESWSAIAKRKWLAGGFIGFGFDHRGDADWPLVGSNSGALDYCGFPKDAFYYLKAWWGDEPVAHILPHWNWAGKEGQPIPVWVYSNVEEVELLQNGQSLGVKKMPAFGHVAWDVPYQPGWLVARALRGGKEMARDQVSTTSAPVALRLLPLAERGDVIPVEVQVVDDKGRVVPTADNLITFSTPPPGLVVGVGNGDPSSHEAAKGKKIRAFSGKCLVLIGRSRPGSMKVTATSPSLRTATLEVGG